MNWHIEERNLRDIHKFSRNPRKIKKTELKKLEESINKFGLAEPLVIQPSGLLIGGHARYMVLQGKGFDTVQCYVPDRSLTDEEMKELCLRLNKNVAGEFDYEMLFEDYNFDTLVDYGFEEEELFSRSKRFQQKESENNTDLDNADFYGLIYRPTWNKKYATRFLSIRKWETRKRYAQMKIIKQEKDKGDLNRLASLVATEITQAMREFVGPIDAVVAPAPLGRTANTGKQHLATAIAGNVALGLGLECENLFAAKRLSRVRLPKEERNLVQRDQLPDVHLLKTPNKPVIFVDDIATTCTTVAACTAALKNAGVSVLPIVWLYSEINEQELEE